MTNSYAWGEPPVSGVIRWQPDDFRVDEVLGYAPTGEGEHLWLDVEKTGQNTEWVARTLADAAGLPVRRVGFAGLKDRNAVARQHFSLHLPGLPDPPWQQWDIPGVRILAATRSARKIDRGRLAGNRFELRVRDLDGDPDGLRARLETIREHGVPNGFGEQRFGGNNVARAYALFRGELKRSPGRAKRGFYLSAARSLIFNRVLEARIAAGNWNRLIPGDCAMLDGSRSIFTADAADPDQQARCARLDIHPTGPLAGDGKSPVTGQLPVTGQALAIEAEVMAAHDELVRGLAALGMKPQRRALRMRVADLDWHIGDNALTLSMTLGSGAFATAVLRELVRYTAAPLQMNEA